MADTIRHQGIVENINGTHLQVRIVQTSACASCSIKGHCSSADTKEKLIDVIDESSSYQPGDRVWVVGELSMGGNGGFACVCVSFSCFNLFPFCFYGYVARRTGLCTVFVRAPYTLLLYIVAEQVAIGKEVLFLD